MNHYTAQLYLTGNVSKAGITLQLLVLTPQLKLEELLLQIEKVNG